MKGTDSEESGVIGGKGDAYTHINAALCNYA
jgi:hypothetical protein